MSSTTSLENAAIKQASSNLLEWNRLCSERLKSRRRTPKKSLLPKDVRAGQMELPFPEPEPRMG